MAFSLNRAQIIGNITRDPEVRQTSSGQSVASFSVATNRVWTDSSGQKQEKVEFHNIVAWRKLAEICQQYLKKGMKVYIEGRMQTSDWTGEDGVKRYKTEIVAENLIMLDRKGQPMGGAPVGVGNTERVPQNIAQPAAAPISEPAQAPAAAAPVQADAEITIEDLPF